jgi:hypothetical protein
MKNSEIHNGLDKKEIRDFLSMGFVKAFEEEFKNKKKEYSYNAQDPFEWVVKDAESQIKYFKRLIEITRGKQAIRQLIKDNGWDEFDVSDETERDLPHCYSLKMNFIGTQKEYDFLLLQINGD